MKQSKNLYSIVIILLILFVGYCPSVSAQENSALFNSKAENFSSNFDSPTKLMQQRVNLDVQNATIEKVLSVLEDQANLVFSYEQSTIAGIGNVTVHFTGIALNKVLHRIFQGTDVGFMPVEGRYVVLVKQESLVKDQALRKAQASTVIGLVTDAETGNTLLGVNILVKGTSTGTITDNTGHFSVNVPSLQDTLVFSYIGYKTKTVPINGRTEVNVKLQSMVYSSQELVVVAYGQQKRSNVTGAISEVDAKAIQGQAVSNLEQAMQGRIPGVQIHTNSGQPGASIQVQIRGIGTFGNSDPLYIVDGIPMQSQDMSTINPNNIKSMEVLKDASAAAIYGARAANGVVLITTKSGQPGKVNLDYNGYFGLQSFTDFIPMLNSQQYADVVNESSIASGLPLEPAYNNAENLKHSTNWQRAAFRMAPMTNHNVRVSGGNENVTYSVGGNYLYQKGILVFTNLKRYSTNIKTKFDITDNLTIGESLIFSNTSGLNRHKGNNLLFAYMLGSSPTMRIYNPDNEGGYAGPNPAQTGINNRDNVIERLDMRSTHDNTNRFLGNVYAEYEILPGLSNRFSFGLNSSMNSLKAFTPTFEAGNRSNRVASLGNSITRHSHSILQDLLTYKKDISDNFSLNLLAGYSQEKDVLKTLSGNIQDFPDNSLQVIDAGTGSFTIGGNKAVFALRSFFGRANFTLFDKYIFTATFRRDGSSRFGKNNKFGNFPSAAVGWIISREAFLQDVSWLSNLKLRASWGKLGNQDIANYANQSTVSTSQRYILGGSIVPGAAVISLGNPSIRWETTTQTDIGVDLGIFNNQLVFKGDYYVKDTKDILLRVPISSATGIARGNGPYKNAAAIRNKGLEFALTYNKFVSNDLNYSISGNISTVKNEVTSLGGQSSIINHVVNAYNFGVYTYTTLDKPISSFYGYIFDGIFQNQDQIDNHATQPGAEPGDAIFRDVNGDGVVNADDRVIIGNPFPDFTYGLSGSLKYKNIDFSLSLSGVQGRYLYNSQRAYLESLTGEHNQRKAVLNRWHGEGTSNTMPRAVRGNPNQNSRASTRFLDNASYLRLQSVQIGYTFSQQLTTRWGVQELRVYFNAQNLFTLTKYSGYNPGVRGGAGWTETTGNPLSIGVDTGSYPIPRIFQLGIHLKI